MTGSDLEEGEVPEGDGVDHPVGEGLRGNLEEGNFQNCWYPLEFLKYGYISEHCLEVKSSA